MPLTSAMAASFVVYPPPSHILRQDILRARKRDPPPRERTDRRTGTTRPSLARAGSHVSKNPVALFGNRIGPGFPRPLSRHTKQTIPTYRTRGPRRAAAPTPLPGRKQLVCSSIPSKSRYAPAELIRKRVPQQMGIAHEMGTGKQTPSRAKPSSTGTSLKEGEECVSGTHHPVGQTFPPRAGRLGKP